jgi:hypothetical protein
MKKLFYGAAALALLIGFTSVFVSCGSSSSPSSPSATATPTPVPATPTPVVFIYGNSGSAVIAGNFQTFLNANNYAVTTVTIAGAAALSMGNYAVIIISDDSDTSTASWGNTTLVNAIKTSAKPVLGLGDGGAYFFLTAGAGAGCTAIGELNTATGTGTSVNPANTSNSLWTTPNSVSTTAGLALYTSGTSNLEEYYPSTPPTGTTLFAADTTSTNYYPLASYTASGLTYFLWGFENDPTTMTTAGKNLFLNVMNSL